MSLEFILRLIGMIVFAVLGARLGANSAAALQLPPEAVGLIFSLVGALVGLIGTPWITTRPARVARRLVETLPTERLVMASLGLVLGLIPASLLAYPLSLLPEPFGPVAPSLVAMISAYLGMTIFAVRARDVFDILNNLLRGAPLTPRLEGAAHPRVLLDTSVIIDGRIKDIADSGFLNWSLLVPRFVLEELQHIADSSDVLRRNRGKRGLEVLRDLKKLDGLVEIIDDDVEGVQEVDHKLVMLGRAMGVPIMTNDFNLNQIAKLQGVTVLNINMLANAVRAEYIPGELITLKIIQEGKESDQGVGYLDDGTMVVVENGRRYLDRTIRVEITRLISREAGKMYFARPLED